MLVGINKEISKTKVAVAMSGGVDSSTVAALLHHHGYKVIGITLQLYDQGSINKKKGSCCAGQDIYDAKSVAEKLGIPHYVLNYQDRFKESVIDDFVDSYIKGETPTPCIKCNQSVKFEDLLNMAKDLHVDCLATGHYVQKIIKNQKAELHKGKDLNKDQSYFLFATTKKQLNFLQFPIGELDKKTTREYAKKFSLAVSDKPDSQDICFVNGSYADMIESIKPNAKKKGKIIHIDGYELGEHQGIINYTIGQRKGIKISFSYPLYVIKIDQDKNIIYVGPEKHLYSNQFFLKDVNILCNTDELLKKKIEVKIRYSNNPIAANIIFENNKYKVLLKQPQKAITKGQACVFYKGSKVLGGGWIN